MAVGDGLRSTCSVEKREPAGRRLVTVCLCHWRNSVRVWKEVMG